MNGRLARIVGVALMSIALTGCWGKKEEAHPMSTLPPPGPKLTDAYLTDDRDNDVAKTTFLAQNEPIYFVFAATNVNHIPIRSVWFADAAAGGNQTSLAEQEQTSAGNDYSGAFAYRPPASGWRPGQYHVDIYFGGELSHTEHFKIVPTQGQLNSDMSMSMNQENTGTPAPSNPPNGVLAPNVTPIPTETPAMRGGAFGTTDAMGNPIMSLADRLQLHTSLNCHDVQFMVEVNDSRIGIYENPDMTADISLGFHPGVNTLRISWDAASPERECQIAIALRRNTRLRTLTQIHVTRTTPTQGAYEIHIRVN